MSKSPAQDHDEETIYEIFVAEYNLEFVHTKDDMVQPCFCFPMV